MSTPSHLVILQEQCLQDSERWFGDMIPNVRNMHSLVHHTLSLCGESGEVANLIKKVDRGSLDLRNPVVKHDVAMELADVLTYLLNVAGILGIDLEKAYNAKRGVNEARFVPARKAREELKKDAGHS